MIGKFVRSSDLGGDNPSSQLRSHCQAKPCQDNYTRVKNKESLPEEQCSFCSSLEALTDLQTGSHLVETIVGLLEPPAEWDLKGLSHHFEAC